MFVFLNDKFVPEAEARVSIFDRGFLYGDGLFESIRLFGGVPFRWEPHVARLRQGASRLKLSLPLEPDRLREIVTQLVSRNGLPDSMLRLALTRGPGSPGYSSRGAGPQTLALSLSPAPALAGESDPGWSLKTVSLRLAMGDPLARFKTSNKLVQVLARDEAEADGADEALLLNTEGHAVEASSGNLFWIEDNAVCTPPVESGVLPGVTRATVFEICDGLGVRVREGHTRVEALKNAPGAFVSLSSRGLVRVRSIDGKALAASAVVGGLQRAYREWVGRECGSGGRDDKRAR